MSIGYEVIASPEFALGVDIEGLAVFGGINRQAFSFGVSAVCDNRLAEMVCDADNVLHKLIRLFENVSVESLNKITAKLAVILEIEDVGVIYMTVVKLIDALSSPSKAKALRSSLAAVTFSDI